MRASIVREDAAKVVPLARVLAYRNANVVDRFYSQYDVTLREAVQIFDDMQRYLWMAAQRKGDGDRVADVPPVKIVDEMWHTFLVFTIDYRTWCESMFGRFLDHIPTTEREKRAIVRRKAAASEAAFQRAGAAKLERYVAHVVEYLGERVARRWYVTYPRRFPRAFYEQRRAPDAVRTR